MEQEVIVRNKGLASAVLITAAFPFTESNKCGTKCGGFISLMVSFYVLQLSRYNRQRVLSLQASLIQYAESRLKNGRDTYAILAKLLNDLKKSS